MIFHLIIAEKFEKKLYSFIKKYKFTFEKEEHIELLLILVY